MKKLMIVTVLLVAVLTACSTSAPSAASAAAHPTFGSVNLDKLHPTSLTIERRGKLQSVKHQPPARYQVNDKELTNEIYTALLSSAAVPKNVIIHCPNDNGISYDMSFYENGQKVFFANVHASGCRFTGDPGKDAYRTSDTFWKLMQKATGMNGNQLWGSPGSF